MADRSKIKVEFGGHETRSVNLGYNVYSTINMALKCTNLSKMLILDYSLSSLDIKERSAVTTVSLIANRVDYRHSDHGLIQGVGMRATAWKREVYT